MIVYDPERMERAPEGAEERHAEEAEEAHAEEISEAPP